MAILFAIWSVVVAYRGNDPRRPAAQVDDFTATTEQTKPNAADNGPVTPPAKVAPQDAPRPDPTNGLP